MKISELEEMGFPKEFLIKAYRSRGQDFAMKINPLKRNSHIIFETDVFEKWRIAQVDSQRRMQRREK